MEADAEPSFRVAVLGLGLIGGSVGLAARERLGAHVVGFDPDERVRELALERGVVDVAVDDVAGLGPADVAGGARAGAGRPPAVAGGGGPGGRGGGARRRPAP